MRLSRVFVGVLLGLSAACATPFEKIDMASLPTADEYPEHNGIVLLREHILEFKQEGGELVAIESFRWRSQSFVPGSVPTFSWIYSKDVTEVRELALRGVNFYEPGDEIVVHKGLNDVDTPVEPQSGIYSNFRKVKIGDARIASLPPGSVTETFVEVAHKNADVRQFIQDFGLSAPTAAQRMIVRFPSSWEAEWKSFEKAVESKWEPEELQEGGITTWTWEKKDIPAIDDAPGTRVSTHLPSLALRLRKWTVNGEQGEAPKSFAELSKRSWSAYEAKREGSTADLKKLAAEILKDAPKRPLDKAATLYTWVRDKVTYCQYYGSFEEGFVPHDARQTEDLRYGDCKDQSNLLFGLLQAAGIDAQLGTLFRHKGIPNRLSLPSLGFNTNHVAVMVNLPEGNYFADPTNTPAAFGEMMPDEYGSFFIPLTKAGAEPVQLPVLGADETVDKATIRIEVAGDMSQKIEFERTLTGAFAVSERARLMTIIPENWKTSASLPVPGGAEESTIENGEVPLMPKAVSVKGTGRAPKADPALNLFTLSPHRWGWRVPGAASARVATTVNPVVTSFPYTKRYEVRITYPSAANISSVPANQTVKSDFGAVTVSYEQNGKELIVRYEEVNNATMVPPEKLPEFRAWVQEADKAAVSAVVIKKGAE